MGKRKDRRLTSANRRVKLDLLAEPSGDFGDSSNQEEVEVGGNGKHHAGSPNSPSSSGGFHQISTRTDLCRGHHCIG
ncbi:hypothetical protein QVD17_06014 [Tagetes erecta]|uniref:Uncharacterized protein n=1 Tax=Tagetes erecta TaxID=13708 RepID=A0AAD8LD22_TARER|nr:hypothetical protein QVD17_06014 [Tagetes erecta]